MTHDESVLVQLARMEVMLASILEKVTGHGERIDKAEQQLATNTLAIQRLKDNAAADKVTVKATADALKTADEARRSADEQKWTPFQRSFIALSAATAVAAAVIALFK